LFCALVLLLHRKANEDNNNNNAAENEENHLVKLINRKLRILRLMRILLWMDRPTYSNYQEDEQRQNTN